MIEKYKEIGTENHDIGSYKPLLEHARDNKDQISLFGGFIPRTYARNLMKEGEENAIKAAIEKDFVPSSLSTIEGTDFHYDMFESMISGRDMHDPNLKPNDNYRKIFKAQLIKDIAMSHKVCQLFEKDSDD